ncbi:MAG: T9SS type A sorting domain-containing protein [Flavobacteriales bacterium]
MTKYFLLLVLVFPIGDSQGQMMNGDFEQTDIISHSQCFVIQETVPLDWYLAYPGIAGAVLTDDTQSGTHAVKLWSWYFGQSNGELLYGNENDCFSNGLPIDYRPATLTGWYKYQLVNSFNGEQDKGLVEVFLFKYNEMLNQRDTIGYSVLHLDEQNDYSYFETTIQYLSEEIPDTVFVHCRSSLNQWTNCNEDGAGNCNYLYIDNFSLTFPDDIAEKTAAAILAYPNPASAQLTIRFNHTVAKNSVVEIFDIMGNPISVPMEITGSKILLEASGIASGIYGVKINSEITQFIIQH